MAIVNMKSSHTSTANTILKTYYQLALSETQKSNLDNSSDLILELLLQIFEKFTESKKRKKILSSFELMIELHLDQKENLFWDPFITHPLKVVKNVLHYWIKDEDLVICALLHDSVEDQCDKLALRSKLISNISNKERALDYLSENYWEKVAKTVCGLSIPKLSNFKNLSKLEKIEFYTKHIKQTVSDDQNVFIVKWADFFNNALWLSTLPNWDRKEWLKQKYKPTLINTFKKMFENLPSSHPLYSSRNMILERIAISEDYS